MIDRLARIKINAIMVEFEDKLRYKSPLWVGASNAIYIEEYKAISRYAHHRYIEMLHKSFLLVEEKHFSRCQI